MSFIQILPEGGLSAAHTEAKASLGALHQDNGGNVYRYVLVNASSGDLTTGQVVYNTATQFSVTNDYSAAPAKMVVGVAQSSLSAGEYGWIQVGGKHDAVWTDAGVGAGDPVVGHTVDGEVDSVVTTTEGHLVFGYAQAADTTTDQHTAPVEIVGIIG